MDMEAGMSYRERKISGHRIEANLGGAVGPVLMAMGK